jgi:PAS domain S-box-containing protein
MPQPHDHTVEFYEDDFALIESLTLSIGGALLEGRSAIVIATPIHRERFTAALKSRGLDPDLIVRQGRLRMLDAAQTLSLFLIDEYPDAALFHRRVGGLVQQLAATSQGQDRRIAAYGEMVALLWADGNRQAALDLEQLWNQLAIEHSFHLHCAYPMRLFGAAGDADRLRQICSQHSEVISPSYASHPSAESSSLHNVILHQQAARSRESELHEQQRAQEAIFRLAAIVESSDDAIISKDLNGIVSSWNESAERILGYTAEEIIGRPVLVLIPPELQVEEVEILRRLRAGERIDHFETVRLTKSGERIHVSLTVSPVKDQHGRIIGAAKILRDVTQQKKLEAALHTTERLASVGRLAATVAHEINNPLEAVLNCIYLAKTQPGLSDETRDLLHTADSELGRVAHIAQQTLGFYRDNSQPAKVGLSQLIRDVVGIYEGKMRQKSLRLEKHVQEQATLIGLQGELKQIISNLLANAIDACETGGKVIIRCRTCTDISGVPGVRITIADTGGGIALADRRRLFEPFFTTKKSVGTGLGLWITKDLLEKRGGSIRFRSSIGAGRSGTAMSLFLPAA